MNTADALATARQHGLDLVEVAPTAVPPVCRLLDYGRFKYEQEKKDREARKNQKVILLKEVRFRPKTDDHDLNFKTKAIERFIEDGEKVKVTIRFRGRELAHPNIGRQVLEQVAGRLKNIALVERMPQLEGNAMTMILSKGKTAVAPAVDEVRPAPQPTALTPAADGARPAPQRAVAASLAGAAKPVPQPAVAPPLADGLRPVPQPTEAAPSADGSKPAPRPRTAAAPAADGAKPVPRPRTVAAPAADGAKPASRPRTVAAPAADGAKPAPRPRTAATAASGSKPAPKTTVAPAAGRQAES